METGDTIVSRGNLLAFPVIALKIRHWPSEVGQCDTSDTFDTGHGLRRRRRRREPTRAEPASYPGSTTLENGGTKTVLQLGEQREFD